MIEALVTNARALVFDFDGTLVDSNAIKWRGFEVAFSEFPERMPEIMEYCRSHNHTIRGDKFRYVYDRILKLPYSVQIDRDLHERFAAATTEQIVNAPDVPGAFSFLERYKATHPMAILSSTPHDKLLYILERRNWSRLFKYIQGAPINKAEWLADFRKQHKLSKSELVFFGDTPEDAAAAREAECIFIEVNAADGFAALS